MSKYILLFLVCLLGLTACKTKSQRDITIELARKPYLQSAFGDSLTILWRTDTGTVSKVAFKPRTSGEWQYAEGVTRTTNTQLVENEVTLRGLAPETDYTYRIFTDEKQLLEGEELWFTSPVAAGDTTFSFYAVGDIGEPVELEGTPDQLAKALEPYRDTLQFGLLLGDIIYPDGKSEVYDKNLFQYFGEIFPYVPVFTVLGNHDWHEPDENYVVEWKLPGNEHYYSFDYGNIHFVALDTKNGEMYDYDNQIAWLKDDLSRVSADLDWTVVFLHHNGKSCTYKDDYEGVVSLYPIFDEYEVDLVLNGHAHTYERLNPQDSLGVVAVADDSAAAILDPAGFISITVGSGGKLRGVGSDPKAFTPNPDSCRYQGLVAAYAHEWAFLNLHVKGREITGEAISTHSGEVLDRFVVKKGIPKLLGTRD